MNPSMKEIKELLAGLAELALCAKKVTADGKVSLADLPELIALLQKQALLMEAVKGLDSVQLKEIGLSGAVEIVQEVVAIVEKVKAA